MGTTHAVLCGTAAEKLAGAPIKEVAVTDTIPLDGRARQLGERISVLSISGLLGEAMRRIHTNESISALFV